jgi:hypothetical protein
MDFERILVYLWWHSVTSFLPPFGTVLVNVRKTKNTKSPVTHLSMQIGCFLLKSRGFMALSYDELDEFSVFVNYGLLQKNTLK